MGLLFCGLFGGGLMVGLKDLRFEFAVASSSPAVEFATFENRMGGT